MDDYEHSFRRMALIEPATISSDKIRHSRALQHLKEGFNRRVLMLDATIRYIHDRIDETAGSPISAFLIPELAVFVNSFWLNICGALDNLAWAINYEFVLVPSAAEDVGVERLQIRLFHKKFWKQLEKCRPELVTSLESFKEWHGELAKLRDPGAHRIPIYPIPAVMDSKTGAEAQRLYAEGARLINTGAFSEGMELFDRGYNLGVYKPWIALSHDGHVEFLDLLVAMRRDEEQFVRLSRVILDALFK
jgi:hypothetical protein